MGLTGLASPSDEADNVDIYAIEVKEIKGKAKSEEEVIEHYKEEHVAADDVKLEGTGKARDVSLFLSLKTETPLNLSLQKLMTCVFIFLVVDQPTNVSIFLRFAAGI
jgi:hypothetical protein